MHGNEPAIFFLDYQVFARGQILIEKYTRTMNIHHW